MTIIKTIDFPEFRDNRGGLVSIEVMKTLPFDIRRVYYIYDTPTFVSRGFHAHKKLSQVAICLSGSCRFVLDNGKIKESIILDNPSIGLLVEDMIWREMHDFSDDCVLLVLASEYYDEQDYIRDYDDYILMVNQ